MGVITELKICLKHVPAQLPFRLDQRTGPKFLGLGFFDISVLFKNVRNIPDIQAPTNAINKSSLSSLPSAVERVVRGLSGTSRPDPARARF